MEAVVSEWPDVLEIVYNIAPTSFIVLAIVALGYWTGRRSRDGEVAAKDNHIDDLQKRAGRNERR